VRHQRFIGRLVIDTIASVTLVETCEDFVRLVDYDQVEWRTGGKRFGAALASGELAAEQVHSWGDEVRVILARLDAEQVQELVLPLANQRFWDNKENALRAFSAALGDDQTGLDGLTQPHFVRKDAPTLAETPEGEDDGVDLMRIRIDPCLTLRRGVALAVVRSANANQNEAHVLQTSYGTKRFSRNVGEALHPEREPLEVLAKLREIQGEYNFAGQYQQAPAPLGGGLVKTEWFKSYTEVNLPTTFEMVFQSWDTANKPTELSDYSVCTTWGIKEKRVYLLNVFRKRLGYPELKRAVGEQAGAFNPKTIMIEDKASGTQLIQELVNEGMHAIKKYEPTMDKIMRMHSVTGTIENGFVYVPDKAAWLAEYLHELTTFPKGKYDDQADSTSQALDWFKNQSTRKELGVIEYMKKEAERMMAAQQPAKIPESRPCSGCDGVMSQRIAGGLRCMQCGAQWPPPGTQQRAQYPTRTDILNGVKFGRF